MFGKKNKKHTRLKKLSEEQINHEGQDINLEDLSKIKSKEPKLLRLFNMYYYKHLYNKNKDNIIKYSLDNKSMQIEVDRYFTQDKIVGVWYIESTGAELPMHFLGDLKRYMDNSVSNSRTVISLSKVDDYTVNFNKDEIRDSYNNWIRSEENMKKTVSGSEKQSDVDLMSKSKRLTFIGIRRMIHSFKKINTYLNSKQVFKRYVITITGACSTTEEHIDYAEKLLDYCNQQDVTLIQVKQRFVEYFKELSIISKRHDKSTKKHANILLSNADIAQLDGFLQGKVGHDFGVYIGSDFEEHNAIYLNFNASPKAQNILITALTGGGKSFFVKVLLLFHALCGHRIALMDYEGTEYSWLYKALNGLSVNMGTQEPVSFNSMVVPNCDGLTREQSLACYDDSFNATERKFLILVNQPDIEDDLQILFMETMNTLFGSDIQRNNVTTYYKTESLTYFDFYNTLEKCCEQESFLKKHSKTAELALYRLEPYWGRNGNKRYMFEKTVNINEILSKRILHFNYGMQNNTSNTAPPKEQLLKISDMAYVFSRYHAYNLKMGFYTVNLLEEFQRSSYEKMFLRIVNQWQTGGRKGNIINYIITNSVSSLLQSDNLDAIAIRDNFTMYIIGMCRNTTRRDLVEAFDLQEFQGVMHDLALDTKYENAFLVIFNQGKTRESVITRMEIPKRWHTCSYFETRRTEEYTVEDLEDDYYRSA